MPTRRRGGFRLGRKLLSVWRWALCHRRRRRGRGYLRLQPCHHQAGGASSPSSSTALLQTKQQQRDAVALVGSPRMLMWGRSLARRGLRLLRHRGPTKDRLLEDPAEASTPKGKVAVYVGGGAGESSLRYVVPVVYFNHPLFGELLREAEEEFGFEHPGGITIPCAASRFERAAAMAAAGGGGRKSSPGGWW